MVIQGVRMLKNPKPNITQAYLGDIMGSVPDHHNKDSIEIK